MRTLVTGASGFLGRHLVEALRARGDFVVGLVRDMTAQARALIETDRCRGRVDVLGSFDEVERAIAEYEVDVVFHLAAQVQVSTARSTPASTLSTNVEGTWKVLEACRRQAVKRVVVASSDKAYGDGQPPYVEDQPLRPHGIYATSKACTDLLVTSYVVEYGLPAAVTRCANLYGPGQTNWSAVVPGTIRSVLRGERPVIRSDGSPRRDYLFVGDAVAGYIALADSGETGAWNFGTGRPTSVTDIVGLVLRVMQSDLTPVVLGGARGEIRDQWLDSSKAERLLGWRASRDLARGLEETVPWYKSCRHD